MYLTMNPSYHCITSQVPCFTCLYAASVIRVLCSRPTWRNLKTLWACLCCRYRPRWAHTSRSCSATWGLCTTSIGRRRREAIGPRRQRKRRARCKRTWWGNRPAVLYFCYFDYCDFVAGVGVLWMRIWRRHWANRPDMARISYINRRKINTILMSLVHVHYCYSFPVTANNRSSTNSAMGFSVYLCCIGCVLKERTF